MYLVAMHPATVMGGSEPEAVDLQCVTRTTSFGMPKCELLQIRKTEHEIVWHWRRTELTAVPRLDVVSLHLLGFHPERAVMQRGLAG